MKFLFSRRDMSEAGAKQVCQRSGRKRRFAPPQAIEIAEGGTPRQNHSMISVLLFSALLPFSLPAQDALPEVSYPKLAPTASDAQGFVPDGWRLEAQQTGDLNGDGLPDLALALQQQDSSNIVSDGVICGETVDTNPRILVVALAQRSGDYRLMVQDHTLIPRYDNACAEDWFSGEGVAESGLEVARGAVRVRLGRFMTAGGWGMGSTTYTFRWQGEALRLVGFDYTNVQRNTGEMDTLSINYLTRRVKITEGSISESKQRSRWSTIPDRPLLTIEQVGNGMEFNPNGLLNTL